MKISWSARTAFTERMSTGTNGSHGGNSSKIFPYFMAPPSLAQDTTVLIIISIYAILFLVGVCGNVSVMNIMYQHRQKFRSSVENTMFYIIALCSVDFLVILSIPIAILETVLGHWMFGTFGCKVYWTLESLGKILSTYILTAMSFDRYLVICHPNRKILKSRKSCLVILGCLTLVAIALLSPLPYSAREIVDYSSLTYIDGQWTSFRCAQCIAFSNLNSTTEVTFVAFDAVIFCGAYCIPGLCWVVFYSSILSRLRKHIMNIHQSNIPLKRITQYTFIICGFYFACWTPYWITVFSFALKFSVYNNSAVYLLYFVHSLPFTNSAFNWVFYALLNSQVRILKDRQKLVESTGPNSYSQLERLSIFEKANQGLLKPFINVRTPSPPKQPAASMLTRVGHQSSPVLLRTTRMTPETTAVEMHVHTAPFRESVITIKFVEETPTVHL